jgi:hypothetical protein
VWEKRFILLSLLAVLFLFLILSCYDRYPYFIQVPEFSISSSDEKSGGVYLSMSTPDEGFLIRYTMNSSDPSESFGALYEEPVYLTEETGVAAVAYRVGYPAGPVARYYYDPANP